MNLSLSAQVHHEAETGIRQYLSFLLAGHVFAVPLARVAEICPIMRLNTMPHMPKGVEGILDLRGAVIPVINTRIRMGFGSDTDSQNIIILDQPEGRVGILVDKVRSVISVAAHELTEASALLSGPEGAMVSGFLNREEGIIGLLSLECLTAQNQHHTALGISTDPGLERHLDEALERLIAMAPMRDQSQIAVIPSIEGAISHSETEVNRIIGQIEAMLSNTDQAFSGITRLKQEARLGRITDVDKLVADVERSANDIQDSIFEALNTLQFQDIARQKLERVLRHIHGMSEVMGYRLQDPHEG